MRRCPAAPVSRGGAVGFGRYARPFGSIGSDCRVTRQVGSRRQAAALIGEDGFMYRTVEIHEAGVVGTFAVPDGPGPRPGVVALSGSDGGIPSWWCDVLAPHGLAVLAAAYVGVDPLPSAICEIPVEIISMAGDWLRQRPEVVGDRVGLIGGSKGAELALVAAAHFPDLFGPVVAIAPQSVVWFGFDPTGQDPTATSRSSWSIDGDPLPFVPPVPGIRLEQTERGHRAVGIYQAALEQTEAVAAATISVELATGPLLLLSGGQDGMCPATFMAKMICDRMNSNGRRDAVRHVNFPDCGHVIVRPWPPGQAPPIAADIGGTDQALDDAHDAALPEVVRHLTTS